MHLGQFDLATIPGGRFRLDGGAMFGVVPRPLWSNVAPHDEANRIQLATNCVLVSTGAYRVLIDTGFGTKLSAKEQQIFATEGEPLVDELSLRGLSVEDIDLVVLSHLHFDHAGGGTRLDDQGRVVPTFPRATYLVQRREWDAAVSQQPEWAGTYPPENFACLAESGQLRLVDGDEILVPGIRALWTGGHSPGHQAVVVEDEVQTAIYLGDLCPTWNHLPRMWCMAYDADVTRVRRIKPELLGRIADGRWLALSDHDPNHVAVRLARDPKREYVVAESYVTL